MSHQLDKAINNATFDNPNPTPTHCLPDNTPSEWLLDLTRAAAETFFPQTRRAHLRSIAIDTCEWLQTLGVTDPWKDMREAHTYLTFNGHLTLASPEMTDEKRFFRLIRTIGDVAITLHTQETKADTIRTLTTLGSRALAWLTHELNQEQQ